MLEADMHEQVLKSDHALEVAQAERVRERVAQHFEIRNCRQTV